MVRSRCLLTAVSICLITWLGSGALSSHSFGQEISVAKLRDGKVLEVTTLDGRKRFDFERPISYLAKVLEVDEISCAF